MSQDPSKTVLVKVEGLEELRNALMQLPVELHKGPLRGAVSAAAGVVQKRAQQLAPIKTGLLQNAIYRTRSKSDSSTVQETAIVGVRFGKRFRRKGIDAWYGMLVELGTRFTRPHPFIRPAFDNTGGEQIEAMRTRLAKAIGRIAKKLAYYPLGSKKSDE